MPCGANSAVSSTAQSQHKQGKVGKRALCPFINTTVIEVANRGDMAALLLKIGEFLPDMNLVNMTTSLHRLAKACSEDASAKQHLVIEANQTLLQELLERIAESLLRSEPGLNDSRRQALSNIIWSLGTLRCVQLNLIQITVNIAYGQLSLFKPFELVSTVWAFAKLGSLHAGVREMVAPLQQAAVAPMSAMVSRLGFRFLAMGAWALAASGLAQEPLMAKMAGRMVPMLRGADCCSEVLLDVAWAFSTAGFRHERILAEVSEQACRNFARFQPAELAQLCQLLVSEGAASQAFIAACTQQMYAAQLQSSLFMTPVVSFAPATAAVVAAGAQSEPADVVGVPPMQLSLAGMLDAPEQAKSEAFRGSGSTAVAEEDHVDSDCASDWSDDESEAPSKTSSPSTTASSPPADLAVPRRRRSWADITSDSEDDLDDECDEDGDFASVTAQPESLPEVHEDGVKFHVKNTFLELEGDDEEEQAEDILTRLSEALPFTCAAFERSELDALRVRYQMCRDW